MKFKKKRKERRGKGKTHPRSPAFFCIAKLVMRLKLQQLTENCFPKTNPYMVGILNLVFHKL